jgi:segregation and condensation protein B
MHKLKNNNQSADPKGCTGGKMEQGQVKRIIEALLFVAEKPLTITQIKEVLEEQDSRAIKAQIESLRNDYKDTARSFNISEVAGGYRITTNPEYALWLKKLYRRARAEKLSRPSLETLAIVAYRQPVTRQEVEGIRGVSVDGVLKTLLDRALVRYCGRKPVPGRPFLYSTTRQFLEFFGLQSLDDLPKLEDFGQLTKRGEQDEKIKETASESRPDR